MNEAAREQLVSIPFFTTVPGTHVICHSLLIENQVIELTGLLLSHGTLKNQRLQLVQRKLFPSSQKG
jgi:hypothetical protein